MKNLTKGQTTLGPSTNYITLYHVTEVLIMVIAPSGVGFVNYEYDHRQNWTSMTRTPSYKCSNRAGDNNSRLIVVL